MNRRSALQGLLGSLLVRLASADPTCTGKGTSPDVRKTSASTPIPNSGEGRTVGACAVNTGFRDLDGFLGDLGDGTLISIAGRPLTGQIPLTLAIAAHVAVRLRQPVTIFGAPMNEQMVLSHMIAFLARVEHWTVGKLLAQAAPGPVISAMEALEKASLLIDDRPFMTPEDLLATVRRRCAETGMRHGLTAILEPQLIEFGHSSQPLLPQYSPGEALVNLSMRCGGVVLCALPLTHRLDEWYAFPPGLMDLAGLSRMITRDSDAILLLDRECVYDANADPEGVFVRVARNRFGDTGGFWLAYEAAGGFADYDWTARAGRETG